MDEEARQHLLNQVFENWITPEVEARQAKGLLPKPTHLIAAQVLFPPDAPHIVRLNDEIKGVGWVKTIRAIEKGEKVTHQDMEKIEIFDVEGDDLDCGHFTLFNFDDKWFISFNLMRRRGYCAELLRKAEQFLEAARFSFNSSNNAPAVDNLFSAAELTSKAYLLVRDRIPASTRTHGPIISEMNIQRKVGNVESAFVDLFNKLSRLRQSARYNAGLPEGLDITVDDLELVELHIKNGREQYEPSGPVRLAQAELLDPASQ